MNSLLYLLLLASAVFSGMILCMRIGHIMGVRAIAKNPEWTKESSLVDGSIFALYGLLIAFTFSSAGARFEQRRNLIVLETNDIGTAYLRLNLLAPDDRALLQQLFRQYLESRIRTSMSPDILSARQELETSKKLQGDIWNRTLAALSHSAVPPSAYVILLPALNEMFDIVTTRVRAAYTHTPVMIYGFLFAIALGCSILVGYNAGPSRSPYSVRTVGFALISVMSLVVILDLEFPRYGLIRLDIADQALVELQTTLSQP